MRSRILKSIVTAGAALALVLPHSAPAPATAQASDQSPSFESVIEERLEAFAVPDEFHESLTLTALQGEPLLSDSGTPPSSVEPWWHDGMHGTISRWDDGSYQWSGMERPQESLPIGPSSVSGCTVYTSAGASSFTNCRVSHGNLVREYAFTLNFSRWPGRAQISGQPWGPSFDTFCAIQSSSFNVLKRDSYANSAPAKVRLTVTELCGIGQAGITGTWWIQANIGPTSSSTSAHLWN
ncbi:hypothetical protein [Agrococcus casei]|uniref:hypothetical protein n=1 Tax=Agrococcus casei TaxID=343512 RepID=UPI0011774076|nr:hypothetical protein [Agrococcus casei]